MRDRQKIFFISAIVLLALISLIEGIVLLRNSFTLMLRNESRWHDLTASVSETFRSLVLPTAHPSQTDNALAEKENIILQETAEDLENMQNQINRLLYEMARNAPFTRQNISRQDRHDRQDQFHPPDNIQRLQAEIAHIFQRAHDSRHSGALNLIEQDWRDVGEISSVNLDEDGTNYVVTVSMPGFERTDININLNGRILTVEAGTEQQPATRNSPAAPAAAQSGFSGRFKTQIMLPSDIIGESAQASYENSILKITIPRKPASNSLARRIIIM